MADRNRITKNQRPKKPNYTDEIISINLLADRCQEVILSDIPNKKEILRAQVETIQRMLLPQEYTAHFAEINRKIDDAIVHNHLEEAEALRQSAAEILNNDPAAQLARSQAVYILSSAIEPKNLGLFYDTLESTETAPSTLQKAAMVGHKVLSIVMKYRDNLLPAK